MSHKILVIGASGHVGRPLVDTLLARGEQVKAATRSGKPVAEAEGVQFDLTDPATFDSAFAGVDRAFIMLPSGILQITELLMPLIDHAKSLDIKVVMQSVFGVDADDSIPYRQVEIKLEQSGIPYVILRPNWFADNFHTFWKAGIDQGVIALPAGEDKTSFIDVRDIAECAACALTSGRFDNRAYNLTGPEALSYAEAAEILSEVIAKPIVYQPISDESFIESMTAAGVPLNYAQFLASIFYPVREGWTAATTDGVEVLTGNPPRSLGTYAKDHVTDLSAG